MQRPFAEKPVPAEVENQYAGKTSFTAVILFVSALFKNQEIGVLYFLVCQKSSATNFQRAGRGEKH